MPEPKVNVGELKELALLFLRLGATSFGGPAVHIAMMEEEVVRRKNWLTSQQFLDMVAATNFIPGPNSTEMAIHIGYNRAGWKGLIVAGVCFIVPAVLIVTLLAAAYVKYNSIPAADGLLYGVKPVVIAVVLQAIWRLGRSAVKDRFLSLLALFAVILNMLGVSELSVLFVCAVVAGVLAYSKNRSTSKTVNSSLLVIPFLHPPQFLSISTAAVTSIVSLQLWPLFLAFLRIGSVLYGSGYVLLAFLRADLVDKLGWLSEAQLLDAIAVGQITPGPLFTTATFIGYLLAGTGGAAVATLGIFLPAFLFVALSAPFLPRLRNSPVASATLDGINVASLALMAIVTVKLGTSALVDPLSLILALLSAWLLLFKNIRSTWLILGAGMIGVTVKAFI